MILQLYRIYFNFQLHSFFFKRPSGLILNIEEAMLTVRRWLKVISKKGQIPLIPEMVKILYLAGWVTFTALNIFSRQNILVKEQLISQRFNLNLKDKIDALKQTARELSDSLIKSFIDATRKNVTIGNIQLGNKKKLTLSQLMQTSHYCRSILYFKKCKLKMKIIYFPISGSVQVAQWKTFSKMRKEDCSMRVIIA